MMLTPCKNCINMKWKQIFNSSPFKGLGGLVLLLALPHLSHAKDITTSLQGMQPVLNNVYNQMMPLCSSFAASRFGLL